MLRSKTTSACALIFVSSIACNDQKLDRQARPTTVKALPQASTVDDQASFDSRLAKAKQDIDGQALVDATLGFRLSTSGTLETICSGQIQGKIMIGDVTNASKGLDLSQLVQIGQKQLKCLNINIDINAVLSLISTFSTEPEASSTSSASSLDDIEVQDSFVAIKKLGEVIFSPPRPIFPSFLSAKPQILSNLSISQMGTLTNLGKTYSGTFGLKMDSFGQAYQSKIAGLNWPDTLAFSLSSTGFEGAPVVQSVLFERIQVTISRDPVMLVGFLVNTTLDNIVIGSLDEADRKSFLGSLAGKIVNSDFVKGLVSDIQLTVEVVDFVQIKK